MDERRPNSITTAELRARSSCERTVREAARAELLQFLRKEIQDEDGIDSFDGVATANTSGLSEVDISVDTANLNGICEEDSLDDREPLSDMLTLIEVAKKRLRQEGVERYLRMRRCVRANLAALICAAQAARPQYTEEELQALMVIPNGPGHKLSDFIDEFKRMIKEDAR